MLSGLSNYLFGGPAEEDHPAVATRSAEALAEAEKKHRFRTKSAEYDWTLVDRASRSSSVESLTDELMRSSPCRQRPQRKHSPMSTSTHSNSSAQYHVHADTPSSSSSSDSEHEHSTHKSCFSPPLRVQHPSMHESWLVTPPPCFTLGGASPDGMTEHPMENLLIEHPSMSVYQRADSTGADSDEEDSDASSSISASMSMPAAMVVGGSRHKHGTRQVSNSTHPRVHFARRVQYNFPSSEVSKQHLKTTQTSRKRKEAKNITRSQVQRNNKVQQYNTSNKKSKRKQHMTRNHSGKNNDRKCQY